MTQRLPRRIGLLQAKELMFSGRVVQGEEAVTIGLANQCVPDSSLLESGLMMAKSFLENSWFTLRADKMLINGGLDHTLGEGLIWERENSPGRGPEMSERIANFGKS